MNLWKLKKRKFIEFKRNLIKYVGIYPNVSHFVCDYFWNKHKFLKIQILCSILNLILINKIKFQNMFIA
jgi:hypothetical protein